MENDKKPKKNNKQMRSAFIRVSAENHITEDNEKLGVKAGGVVKYTQEDITNIIDDWLKTKKFNYYIIEHIGEEEKKHWHIVLEFLDSSKCTFNTLKNKFPYGYIDTCRAGVKICVRYLVHADQPHKTQYPWDAIITNAPHKLESYKIPCIMSVEVELNKIIYDILSLKIKKNEIEKIPPLIYIKHKHIIKNAFELRDEILLLTPNRNVKIFLLQGPTRCGKTTFCKEWAKKNNKSICISSASNDPWQDYKDQDIMVLDDTDFSNSKIDDLKKTFDPYNSSTNSSRYFNKLFLGDTVFICTNSHVMDWFPDSDESSRQAIFMRFDAVFDFYCTGCDPALFTNTNEWVSHYTINQFELSDSVKKCSTNGNAFVCNKEVKYTNIGEESVYEFDLRNYININAKQEKIKWLLKSIEGL